MTAGLRYYFGPEIEGPSWEDAVRGSGMMFVRSKGQLALCQADRHPSGRMLTAWEAWQAYGPAVLEEAFERGSAVLVADRRACEGALMQRRELLGLLPIHVAAVVGVDEVDVIAAERNPWEVQVHTLEKIAFGLGLDERVLFYRSDAGGDHEFAVRVQGMQHLAPDNPDHITGMVAGAFSEAASVIRVQDRLQAWLGMPSAPEGYFSGRRFADDDIHRARMVGYRLARDTRGQLGLGEDPIASVSGVVEERLGIPVVEAELPLGVTSATVSNVGESGNEVRGVVMNCAEGYHDAWSRRVNLARGLGHLLVDSGPGRSKAWVFHDLQESGAHRAGNLVEESADAFALAFLAPMAAIKARVTPPFGGGDVANIMRRFGMTEVAAKLRIDSCHAHEFEVPPAGVDVQPSVRDTEREEFSLYPEAPCAVKPSRRGRFMKVVLDCHEQALISDDSVAFYLGCSVDDIRQSQPAEAEA